jgi:hypothetical protein
MAYFYLVSATPLVLRFQAQFVFDQRKMNAREMIQVEELPALSDRGLAILLGEFYGPKSHEDILTNHGLRQYRNPSP